MSGVEIRWAAGGQARIVAVVADAIALRSASAIPPGSCVLGSVAGMPPGGVRIKVRVCRRQPEGDYALDGRLLDLTRADRLRIERLVGGGPAPP